MSFTSGGGGSSFTSSSSIGSTDIGSSVKGLSDKPAAFGTKAVLAGGGSDALTSSESIASGNVFGVVSDSMRKFLERRDQRIIDLSLAPGDDNVSQLCWGGLNPNNPRIPFGTRAINRTPRDPERDRPPDERLYEWREQERFVVKTKVTNPEDEEQYVWVDVCKAMLISAPSQDPFNGKRHLFTFNGKRTQIGVDEGGSSGGGSDSDSDDESSGSPTPGPGKNTPLGTGTVGSAGTNTGGSAAP